MTNELILSPQTPESANSLPLAPALFVEKRRPDRDEMRRELDLIHADAAAAVIAANFYGEVWKLVRKAATDAYLKGVERGAKMVKPK